MLKVCFAASLALLSLLSLLSLSNAEPDDLVLSGNDDTALSDNQPEVTSENKMAADRQLQSLLLNEKYRNVFGSAVINVYDVVAEQKNKCQLQLDTPFAFFNHAAKQCQSCDVICDGYDDLKDLQKLNCQRDCSNYVTFQKTMTALKQLNVTMANKQQMLSVAVSDLEQKIDDKMAELDAQMQTLRRDFPEIEIHFQRKVDKLNKTIEALREQLMTQGEKFARGIEAFREIEAKLAASELKLDASLSLSVVAILMVALSFVCFCWSKLNDRQVNICSQQTTQLRTRLSDEEKLLVKIDINNRGDGVQGRDGVHGDYRDDMVREADGPVEEPPLGGAQPL